MIAAVVTGVVAASLFVAPPLVAPQPTLDACGGFALREVDAGVDFVHDSGARGGWHLPETMGPGVAVLDFDFDGDPDLYLVQSGPFPPSPGEASRHRLYRNRGDGRFEDWTARSGLLERGYGQGALAVDLDGDRATDLFVTCWGGDSVWRNRGDGTFERPDWGLGGPEAHGWSVSAAAADGNGDGDLDLYVARYVELDPARELYCGELERGERTYCDPSLFSGQPDRYYRQEATGRFVDATAEVGLVDLEGKGLGVVFVDLDGDRRPEIYVANDLTANLLFHNRGEGNFEDVSLLSGAAANRDGVYEAGMGIGVGDVDGDGLPELAVTNFDVETNTLYRNLGGLQFEDVAASSGFGPPSFNLLGFGIALIDLDGDGALDAYVANGHIFPKPRRAETAHAQPDLLLRGEGRGRFAPVQCPGLDARRHVARGLAVLDLEGDGDPDLAISVSGGPSEIVRNDAAPEPFLTVSLRAGRPNPEAVGAVVDLADAAGRRQRRWVTAGDSYASTSERKVFFGVAAAPPVALVIDWPVGRRTRIEGFLTRRNLVIVEPGAEAGR